MSADKRSIPGADVEQGAPQLIAVALSGGVDSATAAAMLVEAGHRVVGMTMRLYDARGTVASAGGRCCGPRDIEDARLVCQHLGIPFYVVDFEADFERDVIDQFVDSYLAGETPNPCVKCNQHIKFTPLLRRARAMGADMVATGHYARIDTDERGNTVLRRGVDARKDQSYFLFSMPRHELSAVLFPLGDLDKDQVRERARAYALPNAAKAESQEICFVPDGDYAGFVEARALTRSLRVPAGGELVDEQGNVLGRHKGVHHYTVGQRRGLGGVGGPTPVYVVGIDRERDRVVVGPRASAQRQSLRVRDMRWLSDVPAEPMRALVQVRHRARPVAAEVVAQGPDAVVTFVDEPVVAAPGQAAVLYRDDQVLGGGWIGPTTPA
jgi:tRNA-uridine 2-sulfurtransferase